MKKYRIKNRNTGNEIPFMSFHTFGEVQAKVEALNTQFKKDKFYIFVPAAK